MKEYREKYLFQSATNEEKTYVVGLNGHGYECSCPSWIYSPSRGKCKHIRALLSGRAQVKPNGILAIAQTDILMGRAR